MAAPWVRVTAPQVTSVATTAKVNAIEVPRVKGTVTIPPIASPPLTIPTLEYAMDPLHLFLLIQFPNNFLMFRHPGFKITSGIF